jgi:hypothetical protein
MLLEYSSSGKSLELLKQIAPTVTRAAVLRDPANPAAVGQFGAIQVAAPLLRRPYPHIPRLNGGRGGQSAGRAFE